MKNVTPTDIAKKLEALRNKFLAAQKIGDLYSEVKTHQLNVFFTIYVLTITDAEQADVADMKSVYKEFYSVKFSASRFLIELFLTSLEISSHANPAEILFSMSCSEKINLHSVNKKLLEKNGSKERFVDAVKKGRAEYKSFINKYGKPSTKVPDDIEDYFPDNGTDVYRPGPLEKTKFNEKFGFRYRKFSKLDFGTILDNNPKLNALFETLQEKKVFNSITDKALLKFMYQIYSSELHPSLSAVVSLESFIAANPEVKRKKITERKEQNDVFVKMVGALMVELYEEMATQQLSSAPLPVRS